MVRPAGKEPPDHLGLGDARSGRCRELILDLSFTVPGLERNPTDAQIAAVARDGIRGALEAGWDPESRGRAFRYELDGTD